MAEFNSKKFVLGTLALIFFSTIACNPTKHLKEGEYLYTGHNLEVKGPDTIKTDKFESDWKKLIHPSPNSKFLGIRWGLMFYNLFYTEKEKGLKNFLQDKLGETPVLYDPKNREQVENLLNRKAQNEGFFHNEALSDLVIEEKKAMVNYTVKVKAPYIIDSISYPDTTSRFMRLLVEEAQKSKFIREGNRYDLNEIIAERERLEAYMLKHGYYYFEDDHLIFIADTPEAKPEISLHLELKKDVPKESSVPFTIDKVTIYTNYNLTDTIVDDTVYYENLYILYDDFNFRPEVISESILLRPGDLYSAPKELKTLKNLIRFRTYGFVNVDYEKLGDSSLHMIIKLTPSKINTIEVRGAMQFKSNNFISPELSVSLYNRNFFNGGELLRTTLSAGYDFLRSTQDTFGLNSYYNYGIKSEVIVPRLLFPFNRIWKFNRTGGQTFFEVGWKTFRFRFEGEERTEQFGNNIFTVAQGFQWEKLPYYLFELKPINVSFQKPLKTTLSDIDLVLQTLGPEAGINVIDLITFGPAVTFRVDTRLNGIKGNEFYYRTILSYKGNIALDKEQAKELLMDDVAGRYIFTENDYRFYHNISSRQMLALRMIANIGFPFHDQAQIPNLQLFFIGGSNSVRAFRPRAIGPGTYSNINEIFYTHTGDIHLEWNAEFRHKLNSLLGLGFYVDAGNIWLYNEDPDRPGGKFEFKDFYNELAIATGVGFRFDFNFFILRIDPAFALHKPYLPEGERWINSFEPFSTDWLSENMQVQLSLGYPF